MKKLLVFLLLSSLASAEQIKVSWTAPTTRVNGTPLAIADIAFYQLLINGKIVSTAQSTATTLSYQLPPAFCVSPSDPITMKTLDKNGLISPPSAAVFLTDKKCSDALPSAPSNIQPN